MKASQGIIKYIAGAKTKSGKGIVSKEYTRKHDALARGRKMRKSANNVEVVVAKITVEIIN